MSGLIIHLDAFASIYIVVYLLVSAVLVQNGDDGMSLYE